MADAISEVQKIPLLDQAVLSAGLEEEPHSISAVTLQLLGTCSQHRTKERSRRCKEQHELLPQQYSFRGQKAAARCSLLVQNNSLFEEKDNLQSREHEQHRYCGKARNGALRAEAEVEPVPRRALGAQCAVWLFSQCDSSAIN